jgi:hypothetical protein
VAENTYTFEELQALTQKNKPFFDLRILRNAKLVETDWWGSPDLVMTDAQKSYRQALRDLPATASPTLHEYPNMELDESSFDWPVKPE